jgi:hypothetical protein
MSNSVKENNASIKIQNLFRLNICLRMLEKLNGLNLEELAEKLSFDEFNKIIIKKYIIETSKKFILSLNNYKKGLDINPRVLITAYLIKYYSIELLGESENMHSADKYILCLSRNVINTIKTTNIKNIWNILKEFKNIFKSWALIDKDRLIKML